LPPVARIGPSQETPTSAPRYADSTGALTAPAQRKAALRGINPCAELNAAWYRLLDLAGVCDTLVADADGVYHPALFNDRLVLGLSAPG